MTIRVLSFDFDGCLFHTGYINSEEKSVIFSNQVFLDRIKSENDRYSQSIVMVGSNRQSKRVDKLNAEIANKGSCFPAIKAISHYLDVNLDLFLLADLHGDLAYGTTFARALYPQAINHAEWLFDETKVTVLYAQLQKIALENPTEDIEFYFYDDKGCNYRVIRDDRGHDRLVLCDGILEWLQRFYSLHPDLIPKHVTLFLNQYSGNIVKPFVKIKGTGFVDANFRNTVKEMCQQTILSQRIAASYQEQLFVGKVLNPKLLKERKALILGNEIVKSPILLRSPKLNYIDLIRKRMNDLFIAAEKGDLLTIKRLHRLGIDVNIRDYYLRTPLFRAVESNQIEAVKLLWELGAFVDLPDRHQRSPLFLAVYLGSFPMMRVLCHLGADIDMRDIQGRTPLYVAAQYGKIVAMKHLQALGADLQQQDNQRRTPFYIASAKGQLDALILLFNWHVDITCPDEDGVMPLAIKSPENQDVPPLLLQRIVSLHYKRLKNPCHFEGLSTYSLFTHNASIPEVLNEADDASVVDELKDDRGNYHPRYLGLQQF